MLYLYKIYYQNKAIHRQEYDARMGFDSTLITPLTLESAQSKTKYPLYFVYNQRSQQKIETIYHNDRILIQHLSQQPDVVLQSILNDSIIQEIYHTNELEGVATTKEEIASTLHNASHKLTTKNDKLAAMVQSYIHLIKNDIPLPQNIKDIRTIYDKMLEKQIRAYDKPDGTYFRKKAVYVQKVGAVDGSVIHQGVLPEENIEQHAQDLLSFMINKGISPLVMVGIAHYYFGYIHPFYDGHGRVGRFISSLYLAQQFSILTAISLSVGCSQKKKSYYNSFHMTHQDINKGETNYFVDTFLDCIIAGQQRFIQHFEKAAQLLSKLRIALSNHPHLDEAKKQILFLLGQVYLFNKREQLTVEIIEKHCNINPYQLKKQLKELENDQLIFKAKKRPITYVASEEYIKTLLEKGANEEE